MKSFLIYFLIFEWERARGGTFSFNLLFLLFDTGQIIVANQSVINPSVASLVTCNDILQASAGVCHVPDGLVMPDAGQMTGTTCQSCVITFSDKKSYE